MRCHVYRNLDQPLQIVGFTVVELGILCVVLVGGTELTQLLFVPRVWAFGFCLLLAVCFFWVRRSLGDLFARRLVRFLGLPSHTCPKLLSLRKVRSLS